MLPLSNIDPSWLPLVKKALTAVDPDYLACLEKMPGWLPGRAAIFNAFTHPLADSHYILFGESPYPRAQSANGFAFWDAAVTELWSASGLSKPVNRATSLRNMLKMLLIAAGDLTAADTSQAAIAAVDKSRYVQTIDEFFGNFIAQGFVLLNASLVLSTEKVQVDAKAWRPFMAKLLELLVEEKPDIELVLFGCIAKLILSLPAAKALPRFVCEHPYNISFIRNPDVLHFFQPFHLLNKR